MNTTEDVDGVDISSWSCTLSDRLQREKQMTVMKASQL